jgi:hypothetical protein
MNAILKFFFLLLFIFLPLYVCIIDTVFIFTVDRQIQLYFS